MQLDCIKIGDTKNCKNRQTKCNYIICNKNCNFSSHFQKNIDTDISDVADIEFCVRSLQAFFINDIAPQNRYQKYTQYRAAPQHHKFY